MQQAPQRVINQLEQQLKRTNPQVYKEFQQAKQNNEDPNEYLNRITNKYTPEQRQQWNNLMNGINTK